MDKGYESILNCLEENEKIIFTTDKNFKFGEKNLLVSGEKLFCISNLGKIYIADKNRRLKAIKVNKYDYKERGVKFKVLNKENIIAINSRDFTDNRSESFIINMKIDDFTEICKKLINNPFTYEWNKYSVKFDDGAYESAILNIRENFISINTLNYKANLKYSDIIDFKEKDNSLHIISNSLEAYNILIFAFNENIKEICSAIDEAKKSGNEKIDVTSAKTTSLDRPLDATIIDLDGSFRQELDKTISNYFKNELEDTKNKLEHLDEEKNDDKDDKIEPINKTYKEIEKEKIEIEGDKEEEIEIREFIEEEISDIKIKKPNFDINIKKEINSSYGKLYGSLNSINYKGRQAEIILDNELKIFDKELNKELLSVSFSEYQYTKNDTIVIMKKEDNMILINLEEQDLDVDKFMNNYILNTSYIGYTNDFQPFELIFENDEIIFAQSQKRIIKKINISEIADINLLDENLNFESIAITLMNSEIYKIFVMRTSVKNILRDIYKFKSSKKYIEVNSKIVENTFKNMIKDELSIFYFGEIIKIKNLIDDFYKNDVKNKKGLIENLYNTSVKIKKSYNLVSMYYFEKFDINIDFKMLKIINELKVIEKDILNLANNILRYLTNLQVIKSINQSNKVSTSLSTDMYSTLEKIGVKTEECLYHAISLGNDISDYNFDIVINGIYTEIATIINLKTMYYSRLIKAIVDELEIEKEISLDKMIEELTEYFVQMQSKSKIDNKTRLKDILVMIKKQIFIKDLSVTESIDILNVVEF